MNGQLKVCSASAQPGLCCGRLGSCESLPTDTTQPPHLPSEAAYKAYYLTHTLQTKSIYTDSATWWDIRYAPPDSLSSVPCLRGTPVPHFCFLKGTPPLFSSADMSRVVHCSVLAPSSISLSTAPSIWGDGHQPLPQGSAGPGSSLWFLIVLSLTGAQRGIKIHQLLEETPGTHCMVGPPPRAFRVYMPMPQEIHTDRKVNPSREDEQMDNHLLKRKMLRQLGDMAIHILSLISAVSLYCI